MGIVGQASLLYCQDKRLDKSLDKPGWVKDPMEGKPDWGAARTHLLNQCFY